jgi:heme/copper-type cytochrome/quinol oxidase subunit 1
MEALSSAASPQVSAGISLGLQLFWGLLLLVLIVSVQGAGIVAATKLLRLEDRKLRAHRVDVKAFGILIAIALVLFALHLLEVVIFALFYMVVGAIDEFEPALFFSISAFTTLGHPEMQFPADWRIVGALEGLVGFLLIGWSTAVFVTDMSKLLRESPD